MTSPIAPDQLIPALRLRRGALRADAGREPGQQRRSGVDLPGLWARLRRDVEGEVRFDDGSLGLYSQDASNYFHVPLGVVIPKSRADVVATLAACRAFGAPVVSRAGGTALAGQTCNEAIVIDFSKYLNRIVALEPNRRRARVEPGVICDQLVDAAVPHGLTWGPQPATHDHCCFGGMLANNCGGMRAQQSGIAVHNVASMRVVLYDGTELEIGWMNDAELDARAALSGREGDVFTRLREFRRRHVDLIRTRMPRLPRRVSGYNLDALLAGPDGRFNLARALVGTEGTCVTMLEAELQLVDYYPHRIVIAVGYEDVYRAGDHVADVLGFEPTAAEGMERRLYEHVVKKHMPQQRYLDILPRGDGWLLVELGSHDASELRQRAGELMAKLESSVNPPLEVKLVEAPEEQEHLWNVRESGLGATAFVPGRPDTWPGFEDSAVRPEQMGDYLRDLRRLFEKYGYEPSLYGHFGMGCIHCRVDFALTEAAGVEKYRAFMLEAADLVCGKYEGSLSGEHGDGQARGELLEKMFGSELLAAFEEFKRIWDPDAMMNPGRVVQARPLDADLRLGADYRPWRPETHFKFPDDDGSFAHATLRCVGVGKCRRLGGASAEDDTMCPSFMVTREEKHSTRGRTHLLWEMMRGDKSPIKGRWQDENVKEALDLCLSCKGCKGDCPVNVDVATYKAEFLSHYYDGRLRLRPRHAYAFGMIDRWARIASFAPGFVNLLTQTPGVSRLAKLAAGATQARPIPTFASETFRSWFLRRERRGASARGEGRVKVLLWPDTFNNYFYPQTAQAAVRVLEQLGFEVAIPDRILCCGRPLYDYGMLEQAKGYLERILVSLRPHLDAGTPIVVLEPSCCSVFRDEMPALMPDRAEATKLKEQTLLLSELLTKYRDLRLPKLARRAVVQGHCHHKAIMRFDAEKDVLHAMQLDAQLLDSGCCGLAGSFGFESDKYEISQACGERALLPKVRAQSEDTLILADGFSCRTQIEQGTGRRALHLAEALELAFQHGPVGTAPGVPPEEALVTQRKQSLERSMRRAGVASTLLLGALIGGAMYFRRRRTRRFAA